MAEAKQDAQAHLFPYNVAVGVSGGGAMLSMWARTHHVTNFDNKVHAKIDFLSAFQRYCRHASLMAATNRKVNGEPLIVINGPEEKASLEALERTTTRMGKLEFVESASETVIFLPNGRQAPFLSSTGGQQGSPPIPFHFSKCLQPHLRKLDARLRSSCGAANAGVRGQMDDLHVIGEPKAVFEGLQQLIKEAFEDNRMYIRLDKSCVYFGTAVSEADKNLYLNAGYKEDSVTVEDADGTVSEAYGMMTDGVPDGDEGYIRTKLNKVADSARAPAWN